MNMHSIVERDKRKGKGSAFKIAAVFSLMEEKGRGKVENNGLEVNGRETQQCRGGSLLF